ncbi:MAG: FG-GAP repeat protein [Nitrospirae bacterium]|nr:FG-GAP repeat protein [Nitrospirota bacterium]
MKSIILNIPILLLPFLILVSGGCSPADTPPPQISLLPYTSITRHAVFSLRGIKTSGNAVFINNQLAVPSDPYTFWNAEVTLVDGSNPITVKSRNDFGNESPSFSTTVTLNTTPPVQPAITSSLTSTISPVSILGTKEANADVLLNGKEIVGFTSSATWAYSFSPASASTSLSFSSKNLLGVESAGIPATLSYTGPLPAQAIHLIAPLDGETFKGSPLLFSWTPAGSFTFQIQIASTPDFSSPIIDQQVNPPSYSFITLSNIFSLPSGVYYWRAGYFDLSSNLFFAPARKFLFGKVTGDYNGDGYADILVGAEGTTGPGQVKLFFGGVGAAFIPSLNPNLVLQGENGGDLFGSAITSGDLNDDGYDDMIVGAYHNGAGGTHAGRVYIYYGGPGLHNTPDIILTGFAAGEQFGVSVSSGKDINRDGYDDLLVGANLNSVKGDQQGRAYLFFGGATISHYPDRVFNGENPGDHFGISVNLAGDINGDGYADFLIGAGGDGSASHTGKAYLYDGETGPESQGRMIFSGNSLGDAFGRMVAGVKDVDGDGYDDFLIGAPNHLSLDGLSPHAGDAYLYQGGPILSPTSLPALTLRGNGTNASLGFSATSIGDLYPKDGYADYVVGAYGGSTEAGSCITPNGGNCAGRAEVFQGSSAISSNTPFLSLYSGNTGSNEGFGISLSSPGDVNGDGFADLIAGAMWADQSDGRAYYYNGRFLSTSPDRILSGTLSSSEGFGVAVH